MNFLEKLDFLMKKYGLNKRTLSQKSDIPYTTIDNWYKRGYEGLKLTTLRKLNDFFNTTLDYWILDEITDPNYGRSSGFEVEYDEMEHIKKYRTLDEHGKEMVDFTLLKEWERVSSYMETVTPSPYVVNDNSDYLRPVAAHNSYITDDDEELQNTKDDIAGLKRPD